MEFVEALSIGGDAAQIALVAVLWRLDRRILSVEQFLKAKFNYGG